MSKVVEWIAGWTDNGAYSALLFIPFALLVLVAALRLVKYAEVIIAKTKFGGAFIGGVLLAVITSIPEVVSEISQAVDGAPAASVSNELGSNAFSGLLIAITIIIMFKTPFMSKLSRWSRVMLFTSSVMSFFVSIFMFTGADVAWGIPHMVIGIIPLISFLFFLVMLFMQYKFGDEDDDVVTPGIESISVKKAIWMIVLWGTILTIAALCLNWSVDTMMDPYAYGIKSDSAGGLFLAFAGSLPEIVAFIALVRKKRYIGGVAALVGSHIFNIGITFFGDLAYHNGSYYQNADMPAAAPLAIIAGVMMALLGLQVLLGNKMKNNWVRIIIPSIIVVGYFTGWALMIAL